MIEGFLCPICDMETLVRNYLGAYSDKVRCLKCGWSGFVKEAVTAEQIEENEVEQAVVDANNLPDERTLTKMNKFSRQY